MTTFKLCETLRRLLCSAKRRPKIWIWRSHASTAVLQRLADLTQAPYNRGVEKLFHLLEVPRDSEPEMTIKWSSTGLGHPNACVKTLALFKKRYSDTGLVQGRYSRYDKKTKREHNCVQVGQNGRSTISWNMVVPPDNTALKLG